MINIADLLPLLMAFKINIIGRLYVLEILLLIILMFRAFGYRGFNYARQDYIITFAMLMWTSAQVVSDFVNDTPFDDVMRGFSRTIFLLTNYLSMRLILNDERSYLKWYAGIGIVSIFASLEQYSDLPQIWKFGGGQGLAQISIAIIALRWRGSLPGAAAMAGMVILGISIISLLFNARSAASLLLMGAMLVALAAFSPRRRNDSSAAPISVIGILKAGAVTLLCTYAVGQAYVSAASTGILGEKALEKLQQQQFTGIDPVVGLIVGGRTEILVSLEAISDSPLFGHGSWAKDQKYIEQYFFLREYFGAESGGLEYALETDKGLIPSHSHIFGAWVESGFVGFIFWACVLVILVKKIVNSFRLNNSSDLIFLSMGIWFVWDILFSPFGGERRFLWAYILSFVTFIKDRPQKIQ